MLLAVLIFFGDEPGTGAKLQSIASLGNGFDGAFG